MDRLAKDTIKRIVDCFDYKDCRKTILFRCFSSMLNERIEVLRFYKCNANCHEFYQNEGFLSWDDHLVCVTAIEFEPDNGENTITFAFEHKFDVTGVILCGFRGRIETIPKEGMRSKTLLPRNFKPHRRTLLNPPAIDLQFYVDPDGYLYINRKDQLAPK